MFSFIKKKVKKKVSHLICDTMWLITSKKCIQLTYIYRERVCVKGFSTMWWMNKTEQITAFKYNLLKLLLSSFRWGPKKANKSKHYTHVDLSLAGPIDHAEFWLGPRCDSPLYHGHHFLFPGPTTSPKVLKSRGTGGNTELAFLFWQKGTSSQAFSEGSADHLTSVQPESF